MKIKNLIRIFLGLGVFIFSCKEEPTFQGNHDPDVIKNYHNSATPDMLMDSIESVNFIAKQKLTEIYELSSLFSSKSKDSLMQDILLPQLDSYFLENDTINLRNVLMEMDSLNVYFVDVRNLDFPKWDSISPDSMRFVNYSVRYYSEDKKLIDSLRKSANFILKKEPKKFKNEFVFYFTELNVPFLELKDTISSGVTQ